MTVIPWVGMGGRQEAALSVILGFMNERYTRSDGKGNIFDLEALANRQISSAPQIDHSLCNHEEYCVQDGVNAWHQSQLTTEWLKEYRTSLFYTRIGRDLWQQLMDKGVDPIEVLECVAMATGPFFETEHETVLSQARMLRPFVEKCLNSMVKMKNDLEAIKSERDGPIFVPSLDWPSEMAEFDKTLNSTIPKLEKLVSYYKPLAHMSRKRENHEGFKVAVDVLRRTCTETEIVELLNAGYRAFGGQEISRPELRDRFNSAKKLLEEANVL